MEKNLEKPEHEQKMGSILKHYQQYTKSFHKSKN